MTRAVVTTGAVLPIEVELSSGHTLAFDEPREVGGHGTAPTATAGVSAALAACTIGTLKLYSDRKGWNIDGVETAVDTTYDGPNPKRFAVTLSFPDHLDDEQVRRLTVIAGKCPVHRLLAEVTEVEVTEA